MTVVVNRLGERRLEAVQVSAAFLGVDVVGIGVNDFVVTVVKLNCNFDFPFLYRLVDI